MLILAAIALWTLASPALAQDADPADDPADDPAVAQVDGTPVLMSDIMAYAAQLPPEYQAQFDQIRPFLIQRVIDFRLLDKAAVAAGMTEDEEVQARVAEITLGVARDVYLRRLMAAEVDSAAVEARYQTYLEENPPKEEVRARHILVESEEGARAIIAELDGGADFTELAKERSTGPSSGSGGDLGYFQAEQMVPSFSEAAFALEPGSHTAEPVQSEFGWHVILSEDKRQTAPPPYEALEEPLRGELERAAVETLLAGLRADAEVEIFSIESAPEESEPEGGQAAE